MNELKQRERLGVKWLAVVPSVAGFVRIETSFMTVTNSERLEVHGFRRKADDRMECKCKTSDLAAKLEVLCKVFAP